MGGTRLGRWGENPSASYDSRSYITNSRRDRRNAESKGTGSGREDRTDPRVYGSFEAHRRQSPSTLQD